MRQACGEEAKEACAREACRLQCVSSSSGCRSVHRAFNVTRIHSAILTSHQAHHGYYYLPHPWPVQVQLRLSYRPAPAAPGECIRGFRAGGALAVPIKTSARLPAYCVSYLVRGVKSGDARAGDDYPEDAQAVA